MRIGDVCMLHNARAINLTSIVLRHSVTFHSVIPEVGENLMMKENKRGGLLIMAHCFTATVEFYWMDEMKLILLEVHITKWLEYKTMTFDKNMVFKPVPAWIPQQTN